MKVEFETSKGKFFFYLDNNILNLENSIHGVYAEYKSGNVLPLFKNCEFIGFTKDLTEEQWGEVVDSGWYSINGIRYDGFIDYKKRIEGYADEVILSATESGKSLMDSLEVYLENPYWIDSSYKNCNKDCLETVCSCDLIDKWNKAQEKVGNWLLIKYL